MSLHPLARPLLVALVLGVVAEVLFDGPALGIGVACFIAALLGAAIAVRPPGVRLDRGDLWLAPAALVFATFIALRADPTLILVDLVVALSLAAGAAVALSGTVVTRSALDRIIRLAGWTIAVVMAGTAHLVERGRPWDGLPALSPDASRTGGTLARGLLLAAIPVSLFVALFAAADAVFARALTDLTHVTVDLGELPGQVTFALAGAWLAGGFLAIVVFGTDPGVARGRQLSIWSSVFFGAAVADPGDARPVVSPAADRVPPTGALSTPPVGWSSVTSTPLRLSLGWAEATVVLVAIELVFAAFVVIQVAYLFGGLDTLAASGQTYSQYATRGFHELVEVAILAGAIIVTFEAVVDRRPRIYVAAAIGLLGLTAIVLASAFLRLRLYQDAYGWSELRFYVFVAIVYLGLAIVAVGGLVVRGRSRWAVHVLTMTALAVSVGVNVVGPDAFVASQNVARAEDPSLVPASGKSGLDADYVLSLSDDAVPVLVAALPRLAEPDRSTILAGLRRRSAELDAEAALRSPSAWNLARAQARAALDGLPAR